MSMCRDWLHISLCNNSDVVVGVVVAVDRFNLFIIFCVFPFPFSSIYCQISRSHVISNVAHMWTWLSTIECSRPTLNEQETNYDFQSLRHLVSFLIWKQTNRKQPFNVIVFFPLSRLNCFQFVWNRANCKFTSSRTATNKKIEVKVEHISTLFFFFFYFFLLFLFLRIDLSSARVTHVHALFTQIFRKSRKLCEARFHVSRLIFFSFFRFVSIALSSSSFDFLSCCMFFILSVPRQRFDCSRWKIEKNLNSNGCSFIVKIDVEWCEKVDVDGDDVPKKKCCDAHELKLSIFSMVLWMWQLHYMMWFSLRKCYFSITKEQEKIPVRNFVIIYWQSF